MTIAPASASGLEARAVNRGRETRQFTVEVRASETGSGLDLTGFACVTESSYRMQDMLGEYDEVVRAGAFTKTLREKDDVRLLVNHEGIPIARTKSGTLNLKEKTPGGLWVQAPELDGESPLVQTVRSAMKRGDLDQMSFAFEVTRQEWSPDYTQRDILEVRLYDVSIVTYPANPATSASLRAGTDVDAIDDDEARALYGRLQQRFAPTDQRHTTPLHEAQAFVLGL